jgi:hypothetical protein
MKHTNFNPELFQKKCNRAGIQLTATCKGDRLSIRLKNNDQQADFAELVAQMDNDLDGLILTVTHQTFQRDRKAASLIESFNYAN